MLFVALAHSCKKINCILAAEKGAPFIPASAHNNLIHPEYQPDRTMNSGPIWGLERLDERIFVPLSL